jgi:hypothetical protein
MYTSAKSRGLQIVVLSAIILAAMMASVHADSIWNHNGSTMMLNVDGSRVAFSYLQPRRVIAAQGVESGTVLFSGRRSRSGSLDDWGYTGTAYIFSANCGKHAFAVKGTDMWDPFPKISLTGRVPRIDQQTCRQTGEREETLVFEYQLPDLPGISDPVCNMTEMDAYRACLERSANSICRGRVEGDDQARCFRHVAVLIYRNSGIGGYAKDLAEGSMAPFTDCRNGYCKFSGGGSSYTCTRVSNASIKECDGDNCADVSCPIRQCKVICGTPNE